MKDHKEIDALREALKVSPNNIPLLRIFAKLCRDQWALGEGKSAYEKILAFEPDDKEAQLGIVQILHQMGKVSEASVRIDSLTAAHPHDADVLLCSARIKISDGEHAAAAELYEKVRVINPEVRDEVMERELANAGFNVFNGSAANPKCLNTDAGMVLERMGEQSQEKSFSADSVRDMERPRVTFDDVGGMESVKEEIRLKIIYPSKNPDIYKAYGKKSGGGVLLYGPPGCGKTLVSRATAGEVKSNFISIGLHQILDMYIGNSEKNLHEIFELARQNTPSVLFIDEIDALAANRTDLKHSASRTLINQFLAEMDGDINSNEGVLILGATNAPWHIDSAFRRPGRFDRIIFVPTPDETARAEIIRVLSKDRPVERLDVAALAKCTKDFSGADLKALFDLATEASLKKAMKENRIIPITTNDLMKQAKSTVPSSKAWFESARNYALYSNQSGLYDPILSFLGIKK